MSDVKIAPAKELRAKFEALCDDGLAARITPDEKSLFDTYRQKLGLSTEGIRRIVGCSRNTWLRFADGRCRAPHPLKAAFDELMKLMAERIRGTSGSSCPESANIKKTSSVGRPMSLTVKKPASDAELLAGVLGIDREVKPKTYAETSVQIGVKLGTSPYMVSIVRKLIKSKNDELIESVRSGRTSLNTAFKSVKNAERNAVIRNPTDSAIAFGAAIKQYRIAKSVTQTALSEQLGNLGVRGRSYIERLECGTVQLSQERLKALCFIAGLDFNVWGLRFNAPATVDTVPVLASVESVNNVCGEVGIPVNV